MGEGLDILVVSQFFPPEMGAPAARFHDFGRLLIERGHRVTVLTGFPNSPSGVIPPEYRSRLGMREEIDGIDVRRVWLYTSPRLSKVTKSAGFASFACNASIASLLAGLRADVVIGTSPPPTVGIPAVLAARRLGAGLLIDVRDIWPEAILQSGRLQSRSIVRFLESVERRAYGAAAAISVVTEGKRERLIEKGVPADKLHVVPNGVDLSRFDQEVDVSGLLSEHAVDRERFVLMYAGIFNPPQGLDVLLDAAVNLRSVNPDLAARLQIVLVGDGSERKRLQQRCRDEDLAGRVSFLPIQPRERISSLLRSADALAVTLRPRKDTHTVPSKIYECLASGRPVLVSADGAPAKIIRESGGGFATPAADAGELATRIAELMSQPERAREMGAAGRAYVQTFDRRALVDRLEAALVRIARRPQDR